MANYYFLASSLPPLELGSRPDITFEELKSRLEVNLTKEDFQKTVVLRRYVDLHNIRCLLLEEPFDSRGNLEEKELDEALLIQDILPQYVFDFLNQFENSADRISHFSGLISRYFMEEIPKQRGFLLKLLSFEKAWRLVMLALRAKQVGRDIAKELQFEDPTDPFVAQILAQKDAPDYQPPDEFADLKELIDSCGADPWQKYKVFATYRFNKIEQMVEKPLFSIDWILSYLAQLMIVEEQYELNETKGKVILDTFKTS
jgi:hypothetical protein